MFVEFRFRINARGGCVLIRPCVGTLLSSEYRDFSPVRGFWGTNLGRVTPAGILPPNPSADSPNPKLKRAMRDINYAGGRRYAPRAFRRGATHEIINSGSAFSTYGKAGIWTFGWRKCYIDPHAGDAVNISPHQETAIESDIDDTEGPPPATRGEPRGDCLRKIRNLGHRVRQLPPAISPDGNGAI